MELFKDVKYRSFYSKRVERIKLKWTFEEGFENKELAIKGIEKCGQNPDEFSLVLFKKMYYPVSICTLDQEIVISKEYIWYKKGKGNALLKYKQSELEEPIYVIKDARIGAVWTQTMGDILREFDSDVTCEVPQNIKAKSYMRENCLILVSCAMFDTLIPVYQLGCADDFFADPPSRWKLWRTGIRRYNPFNQKKEYFEKHPYKYQDFLDEISGTEYEKYMYNDTTDSEVGTYYTNDTYTQHF